MSGTWETNEARIRSIIAAFYAAYNGLGFGFLEFVYAAALTRELQARGHRVQREVLVQIYYKGEPLVRQRMDHIVDGATVLELKASENLAPRATRQLYNYLCATKFEDGILLHFGRKPPFFRVRRSSG